jgi:ESS family glutamate:Na+ symporter
MFIVVSFCSLCLLLLAGKALRLGVPLFQRLYLPASVIGGLAGLVALQTVGERLPEGTTAGWNVLPGFLINIVFAAIFLGVEIPSLSSVWRISGPQVAYGQIVAWGQYVVGVGTAMVLLAPVFGVPAAIGTIIPVGFEGGHGTAAGMKPVFEAYGWTEGEDLALTSATFGVICAIVTGMCIINWAVRRGHATQLTRVEDFRESIAVGIYEPARRPSAGRQTVPAASVDSLALHLAIIGAGVFLGYILKNGLVALESSLRADSDTQRLFFESFPLFPLCMFGGLAIQLLATRSGRGDIIDRQLMMRLSGTAMDFLIVAAIATINLRFVLADAVPLLILVAVGVTWNVFCVMWLARRLLPRSSWFERAIAEMGQSMGVTATGLLLLRVVDPEAETDATEAFGYKQLLHEPFMGGGLWTSAAIPLALAYSPGIVLAISVGAVVTWLGVWSVAFRKTT